MSPNPSQLIVQLLCFQWAHFRVKGCEGSTPIIRIARTRARTYRGIGTTLHNPSHPSHRRSLVRLRRGGFR